MQCARRVRESWATLNALSFLLSFCSRRLWPRFSAVFRPHLSSHSPRTRAAIAKRFAQGPYCTPVDADDAQLGANPPTWKNGSIVTTTAKNTPRRILHHDSDSQRHHLGPNSRQHSLAGEKLSQAGASPVSCLLSRTVGARHALREDGMNEWCGLGICARADNALDETPPVTGMRLSIDTDE